MWGYEEFPTTRTIDNFVAKLRQKIERAPHEPEHILTIHGSGLQVRRLNSPRNLERQPADWARASG